MLVLALDTGTSMPGVALLQDRHILVSRRFHPESSLTNQVLPLIDRLLESAGFHIKDVEGLAVSLGPGTFTGLRVGLATMSALRMALKIPMVGVSTLEGLAWTQPPTSLPILSTAFVKPGSLYWGRYRWEGDCLILVGEEALSAVSDVLAQLQGEMLALGDGWYKHREVFCQEKGVQWVIPSSLDNDVPVAVGIGLAGVRLLKQGHNLPLGVNPRYLQPSYAEMNSTGFACHGG